MSGRPIFFLQRPDVVQILTAAAQSLHLDQPAAGDDGWISTAPLDRRIGPVAIS
jgi:hypothetical protein